MKAKHRLRLFVYCKANQHSNVQFIQLQNAKIRRK